MNKPITKKDVWLALLSLDSYHRGYDIQIETNIRSVTHLGKASIITRSVDSDWIASGFYAQEYDITDVTGLSGSNTVIAYRGTDDGPTGGSDIWNGWTIGGGSTGANTLNGWAGGSQADLTIQFYEAVVRALDNNPDRTIFDASGSKPITTGQSGRCSMSEDPRNGGPDDPRNRILGVEAQHIFVSEIATSPDAADALGLLASINFNLEARSNKLVLIARPNMRDAILNAPDAVQQVFIDAGFGWNTQNSYRNPNAHPANDNNWQGRMMEQAA